MPLFSVLFVVFVVFVVLCWFLLFSCCLVLFSVQAIQERGAGHDEMWWFNVESDANGVGGQLRRRGEKR